LILETVWDCIEVTQRCYGLTVGAVKDNVALFCFGTILFGSLYFLQRN